MTSHLLGRGGGWSWLSLARVMVGSWRCPVYSLTVSDSGRCSSVPGWWLLSQPLGIWCYFLPFSYWSQLTSCRWLSWVRISSPHICTLGNNLIHHALANSGKAVPSISMETSSQGKRWKDSPLLTSHTHKHSFLGWGQGRWGLLP